MVPPSRRIHDHSLPQRRADAAGADLRNRGTPGVMGAPGRPPPRSPADGPRTGHAGLHHAPRTHPPISRPDYAARRRCDAQLGGDFVEAANLLPRAASTRPRGRTIPWRRSGIRIGEATNDRLRAAASRGTPQPHGIACARANGGRSPPCSVGRPVRSGSFFHLGCLLPTVPAADPRRSSMPAPVAVEMDLMAAELLSHPGSAPLRRLLRSSGRVASSLFRLSCHRCTSPLSQHRRPSTYCGSALHSSSSGLRASGPQPRPG
jgi:hypothetical protein